jgi:hypothetical protein
VTDLLVFFAVAVLPWIGIGLLRLWRRSEPREESNAVDELERASWQGSWALSSPGGVPEIARRRVFKSP